MDNTWDMNTNGSAKKRIQEQEKQRLTFDFESLRIKKFKGAVIDEKGFLGGTCSWFSEYERNVCDSSR